ncbi:hypothetical protein QNH07_gp08 [Aeromonas phage BUCT696]|uniref:hypothetical protein n=1 Tax=Aeromonas phage BUCT696 TaxID=2911664 RepID=UPI0024AE7B77|nr:hypothetical protein QNH07_gp08 [Aeromonas phage BUCT696]UKH48773.1 hypothetical protein [Aeromonas phage BUCT696]
MMTTIAAILFVVFLALCVAAGYWAFKPLFTKKEDTLIVVHQPTGRVMTLQLDWVFGATTLRKFDNWLGQFESTIHDADPLSESLYRALAGRFWAHHVRKLQIAGLTAEEINQEIQSWTVVVSATGRAHHALEDGKGVHCTRKMHKVLMAYRSNITE